MRILKWKYWKNKYVVTILVFTLYSLFFDDIDIFTIVSQNRKLQNLRTESLETEKNLNQVQSTLKRLKYSSELETYARENKLFKKENEDIFVISYE